MFSFTYHNIPTVDIYFTTPLKGKIAQKTATSTARPIRRLGPYSFYVNGRVVIVRYITDKEISKIRALHPQRCYYLIDDDFRTIREDSGLPTDYRNRLTAFAETQLPKILTLADTIVAPNPVIFEAYPDKKKIHLNPAYTSLCRDFAHFKNPSRIRILFCGTRSHLNDLIFISDTMADICRRYDHVEFTTFLGNHVPSVLTGRQNIVNHSPASWSAFKRLYETNRYHIGIAPNKPTTFNRARSINKILDHAAFGAAGIYSDHALVKHSIVHGKNGLLVGDQVDDWKRAIEELIANLPLARDLAKEGALLAGNIGDPKKVREFWLNEFDLLD